MLREMRPVLGEIGKKDGDLLRQARRAATSVLLNAAEGAGNCGGNRRERYRTALGSMRETTACFDAAEALGYVDGVPEGLRAKMDHVTGTLLKLAA